VFWNYDFSFIKKYELNNDSLTIQFEFVSEKGMPFMLGYHPAFNIKGKDVAYCSVNDQKITIDAILKVGSNAYPVLNQNKLLLFNGNYGMELITDGFENFMLWTEVENMLCIEPITQYTTKTQNYSEKI
jgi:galactose mutarotase-like enzyme